MRNRFLLGLAFGVFLLHGADDTFPPRENRYRLHPGDTIAVSYKFSPEYNATVLIQPDGYASFPDIGIIKVEGLTLYEALQSLKSTAAKTLHDPVITMDLKGFDTPYVVVGGEVVKPGRIEYRGDMSVLRAVELAGGITHFAKTKQVILVRPINGVDGQVRVIDLSRMLDKHDLSENVAVHAGDLLVVPESKVSKIERFTKLVNFGAYYPLP